MSFKTRKIRKAPPSRPFSEIAGKIGLASRSLASASPIRKTYFLHGTLLLAGVWVVFRVCVGAYATLREFDPKEVVLPIAASELKTDEHGYTNIVLLGDGGHKRDGADLVDTIIVASLDPATRSVSMLSFPRDYYVGSNGIGIGRINEVYRIHKGDTSEKGGYAAYQDVVGRIVGLDIHYYLRVDFKAFVEIVDALGGVTVDVKESLYDPEYPNDSDTRYTTFSLPKGVQEMDGETALKFARSRKTTSDFDRALRQQQLLSALQEKALSAHVLTSPSTLKKLYDSIRSNTDTNISFREMIALAEFANGFDRSRLVSKVLNDDPGQEGGFLYTPEREVYGGFVLIPYNLGELKKYTDLVFHHRGIFYAPSKIDILNASRTSGVALRLARKLNLFGFDVGEVSNFLDAQGERQYSDQSLILHHSWSEDGKPLEAEANAIEALKGFFDAKVLPGNPSASGSHPPLSLVLGADYGKLSPN